MSLVIDIADAVTAELAAAPADTFSQAFEPKRIVLPAFELAELGQLRVSVVPKGVQITGATRSASQHEVSVDIGVQKKLAGGSAEIEVQVTQLCDLVQQVADYLRKRPLAGAPYAGWVRTANEPIYVPEHLAEQRVFTSVLTLTYRALS